MWHLHGMAAIGMHDPERSASRCRAGRIGLSATLVENLRCHRETICPIERRCTLSVQ